MSNQRLEEDRNVCSPSDGLYQWDHPECQRCFFRLRNICQVRKLAKGSGRPRIKELVDFERRAKVIKDRYGRELIRDDL